MNYLADTEYQTYGLEPDTPESWVSAACSIVNAHCHRPTLWFGEFTERVRLVPGRNVLRLTYLPLAIPSWWHNASDLRPSSLWRAAPWR